MRYHLSEIAQIVGGRLAGCDLEVASVATDSRSYALTHDTLFVAMQGVNHDAHDHIAEVAERGIKAFMVEREIDLAEGCGAIVVENSLTALQALATHHRNQFRGTVVGITGSNGKTTVKEWIAQCAPHDAKIFRSPRSYNSQLGVALSLLMLENSYDVAIIEAGISQKGEMERLYKMIAPDMVIFTSIGDAHEQGFSSLEEKIDEKVLLAQTAADIIYHSAYIQLAEVVEKRFDNRNLVDAATTAQVPQMTDKASQHNAEIVAAFFAEMGYEMPDFTQLQPVAMRLEVKQGIDNSIIIDDSYSADLNSLSIALDHLRSVAGGRKKVLILSDILQSGDENIYAKVLHMVREAGVDTFVGIGDGLMKARSEFGDSALFFASAEELLSNIAKLDIANCAVLIKGNRASRLERISHRLEQHSHTTVLEVNLQAMARNINYFRSQIGTSTRLVAMVKASSYGAGETEVAQMLQKQGVAYLAVAFADEGVALREGGITMPIVVLNADDASFDMMIAHSLEPEIYSFRSLASFVQAVERAGERNYPIHLKIDSGMHRLGFAKEDITNLCKNLAQVAQSVRVTSIFTHLCVADDTAQDNFSHQQIAEFDHISTAIMESLPYRPLRHAAASEAMLRFEEARFDMCRLGIGLYGFSTTAGEALEPVSTLRTRIVQIRTLHKDDTVGYGRNGKIEKESRIATIPVGYADGLNRHLGNGAWEMIVAGKRAKTVGNICMDSCMIDITNIEGVEEGDIVEIFSAEKGNTAADMAAVLGTIPYEVLTSVAKRVKRIYINE
ncbi:MAG: alanine racemase [Alistipes sp.]|nr:alanine racemase [Alistipes sp.]